MRSRFVRSYTFWLGILVPVFLLWVWVLSAYLRMQVSLVGPHGVRIGNRDGYIRLVTWRDPDAVKWEKLDFESNQEGGYFFPGFAWRWQRDGEFMDIQVSHWMLLVSYAAVFWGLRCWHRRRYRIGDFPPSEA